MFNMATMAADECRESNQERVYGQWLKQVEKIAGHCVDDSDAFDLYADGCNPEDAAAELNAALKPQ
jgi:hypothetical protein